MLVESCNDEIEVHTHVCSHHGKYRLWM